MLRMRPWLALFVLLAAAAAAQEPQPLTNDDVIGLVKAGLSPAVITAKITGSPCRFDTSPAALQQLKAAGVPDEIVVAMLQALAPPRRPRVGESRMR